MMNPRRITLTLGAAAGAAFAAALISMGTAPAASAITGADVDPLEDLFGTAGTNTWTPTADADLGALAGGLDTSVDNYAGFPQNVFADDPFTVLTQLLDPSAFTGGLPDNAIGDLAVGLDYTVVTAGGYQLVDMPLDAVLSVLGVPGLLDLFPL